MHPLDHQNVTAIMAITGTTTTPHVSRVPLENITASSTHFLKKVARRACLEPTAQQEAPFASNALITHFQTLGAKTSQTANAMQGGPDQTAGLV
jgi:hypothetical protein